MHKCRDYHRICKQMFSMPKRRSRLSRALFSSFQKRGSVAPVLPDSTSDRELLRCDALVLMGRWLSCATLPHLTLGPCPLTREPSTSLQP